ncbi:mannose-1-phosphate guanylyltransferase/mannose-6-phosphate isomerase, partial [Escherichia coli]
PSTEYGWIRPGARVEARCHAVHTFAEKPDAGRAATYLADRWLWNPATYLMRADTLAGEYAAFDPATAAAAAAAVEAAADEGGALA